MATSKKKTASKQGQRPAAPSHGESYDLALEQYAAAVELMQRNELEPAMKEFERLAATHTDEMHLGDRCRSFAEICRRKLAPDDAAPQTAEERYFAAVLLSNSGQTAKAIELLDMALQDEPNSPKYLYARASAWALQGNAQAAVNDLRQAISGEPQLRFQAVNDSDFEPIREEPAFIDIIEPTPAGA